MNTQQQSVQSVQIPEKAADRSQIDYAAAVNGGLQLVPGGDGAKALAEDYARMVDDGLQFSTPDPDQVPSRLRHTGALSNR